MHTTFEPSFDRKLLIDFLLKVEIGQVVTYDELSAIIGKNIKNCRHLIGGAFKTVKNTHHFIFGAIKGVGYKRLNDSEIVRSGQNYITHIRRTAKRGATSLACVAYDKLSLDDKNSHNARLTVLCMIQDNSSGGTLRKIEKIVSDSNAALPSAKAAMELLKDVK